MSEAEKAEFVLQMLDRATIPIQGSALPQAMACVVWLQSIARGDVVCAPRDPPAEAQGATT